MRRLRMVSRIAPVLLLAAAACDNGDGDTVVDDTEDAGRADAGRDSGTRNDAGGGGGDDEPDTGSMQSEAMDGPPGAGTNQFPHEVGDVDNGKLVFRFETFGNENFWTDVAKLPAGVIAAGLTPVQALKAGLNVDVEALQAKLDADTFAAVAAELGTDLSEANAPILNNPATTITLLNANAVIGLVVKDVNNDGMMDLANGDKIGVACAFCHAKTDNSVFSLDDGGSIGKVVDGPTPHTLNVGAAFALAANTRALYPLAQLSLDALGGETIGRAPTGLTENSTEAEVDAYFSNPEYYPIGMFDDQPDGTGAPMHITPMFRSDLSAPYGSEGTIGLLDNFSNLVYTALLDPRTITTTGGRAFLNTIGGAAGDEIVEDYVKILADLGLADNSAPQVTLEVTDGKPGDEATPLGVRVDNQKLLDMSAYMDSLQAPAGVDGDADAIASGRELFRNNCTSCHNVDQSVFVPSALIPMASIFPGDDPVNLGERMAPLTPFLNTVDNIFDDKMVVVNASIRGDIRGMAMPLLLDLARKPVFLHDNSVPSLEELLSKSRGKDAPHPFYLDGDEQADMVAFLKSLDTDS